VFGKLLIKEFVPQLKTPSGLLKL